MLVSMIQRIVVRIFGFVSPHLCEIFELLFELSEFLSHCAITSMNVSISKPMEIRVRVPFLGRAPHSPFSR